ncbi:hypothetical protein FQA39_LY15760 [Lamprigera yunnana]|nr:hypothetical protein FQA39_LY15760 [Lamprigera yunnana]
MKVKLHTTEIQDGYDWGRLNLQSVTEESSFQEFLATAQLAGTEFQAEKLNIKFINPKSNVGLLTEVEKGRMKETQEKFKDLVTIPRRPPWSKNMTVEELERSERESFLKWRRSLVELQERHGVLLTPFEKNLEFWRQLWRVVERSDVVAQIVDARNPLLFWCEDLEKYVQEVSGNKLNMVIMNKADFLSSEQRQYWADYFSDISLRVIFFSATQALLKDEDTKSESETDSKAETKSNNDEDTLLGQLKDSITKLEDAVGTCSEQLDKLTSRIDNILSTSSTKIVNSNEILSRDCLIDFFKSFHTGTKVTQNLVTIGLVGYPNVGKSSTINALLSAKKVSVSATPGKTKHFQTLFVDNNLLLCDCPGLVMPSFVYTKAEMIINGILPIDQMRDHVPPINLITSLIPRHIIEDKYGLMLPLPIEGEEEDRAPTAEELLNTYGYNRGFMTANGQPDNPRSSRYILKDFVNGKLLYAHAPPGIPYNVYHTWPKKIKNTSNRTLPPLQSLAIKPIKITPQDVDEAFFKLGSYNCHVKGKPGLILTGSQNCVSTDVEKPWKKENKHKNKKKREKLRRIYVHLDKH